MANLHHRFLTIFICLSLAFLTGCKKHYIAVDQRWIDANYLSSTQVGTPDPRQEHPPMGQMLIIQWFLPSSLLKQNPHVELDLIFWDYTTTRVLIPIEHWMDWATYKCLDEDYQKTKGILTYKAAIVTENGEMFREWKHQLWVNLIQIDPND